MIVERFSNGTNGWSTSEGLGYFGVSNGELRGFDVTNDTWYFVASSDWHGDLSDYLGGTLEFSRRQDSQEQTDNNANDVILTGGGLTLYNSTPVNPKTWPGTTAVVRLDPDGWTHADGTAATQSDMQLVLSNVTDLRIRGEFVYGKTNDITFLDDVVLTEDTRDDFSGTEIRTSFDSGVENWGAYGDVEHFVWDAGRLRLEDLQQGPYFGYVASEAYHGARDGFYGGQIEFTLQHAYWSSTYDDEDDLFLTGGGLTLVWDAGAPSRSGGNGFYNITVALDTSAGWRVGSESGPVATEAQIRQVLSDVTDIRLRGEYYSIDDIALLHYFNMIAATPDAVEVYKDVDLGGYLGSFATLDDALGAGMIANGVVFFEAADIVANPSGDTLLAPTTSGGLHSQSLGPDFAGLGKIIVQTDHDLELSGYAAFEIEGGAASQLLSAEAGHNLITGRGGADLIYGGDGKDTLLGGDGQDDLRGGNGNDLLNGGNDPDSLQGGAGNDTLIGSNGDDALAGEDGADDLRGGNGMDVLFGGAGNDLLSGGRDDDTLRGEAGDDTLFGGDGDDLLDGGDGSNSVYGGDGNDTINEGTTSPLENNDLDVYYGGTGADIIYASGGDTIYGGAGNDDITAFGTDVAATRTIIRAGGGSDTITGTEYNSADVWLGGGEDHFHFTNGTEYQDTIHDFRDNEDTLYFDRSYNAQGITKWQLFNTYATVTDVGLQFDDGLLLVGWFDTSKLYDDVEFLS